MTDEDLDANRQLLCPNRRNLLRGIAAAAIASCGPSKTANAALTPVQKSQADPLHEAAFDLSNLKSSFTADRQYFVVRSGRIQLIAQADRSATGPAFLLLAFDARDSKQTGRKENAFNFDAGEGFVRSALEVILGGFPFAALGYEMETQWIVLEGIPAIEARWWAGGFLVTEHVFALQNSGTFVRRITLASCNLGGPEEVKLRLSLPKAATTLQDRWLVQEGTKARLALACSDSVPGHLRPETSDLEIGPLLISIGKTVSVDTWFRVDVLRDNSSPFSLHNSDTSIRETSAAWNLTSHIVTEDKTVRELYDKVRYGLAGMVADNGIMDAGIFEYGGQWVRDTSNTIVGLLHAGHFELAHAALVQMLDGMISPDGRTMISGLFEKPDQEELDEMGELLHALRSYVDWTGDDSIVRAYRSKLVAVIERPLRPEFRGETGMVHNRREFWERTFEDGYELVYQMYVVLGLREAASMALPLGAAASAQRWNTEADRILSATLSHPTHALVEGDRLIKRRSLAGTPVRYVHTYSAAADVPMHTEKINLAEPDAGVALPIALGLVDPASPLARNTLDDLEKLWNARWFGGGYERYNSSGEPDQPGPWPVATCFILRAQHDAKLYDRSRRTLEWLNTVQGGRTGAWFEEIPLIRSQSPNAGILPWTSAEISLFLIRHLLGVRFKNGRLTLKPALFPGSPPIHADLRFHTARLYLDVPGAGPFQFAYVNGRPIVLTADGAVTLGEDFQGGSVSFHNSMQP